MASTNFTMTILGFREFMNLIQVLKDDSEKLPPRVVLELELFLERAERSFK